MTLNKGYAVGSNPLKAKFPNLFSGGNSYRSPIERRFSTMSPGGLGPSKVGNGGVPVPKTKVT